MNRLAALLTLSLTFAINNGIKTMAQNEFLYVHTTGGTTAYRIADIDSISFLPSQKPAKTEDTKWSDTEYMANFNEVKNAVLLDITERNGETETSERNLYSAKYIYEVAGISYKLSTDLTDALATSDFILLSSVVQDATFTASELQSIKDWLNDGGTMIVPAVNSASLADIFGISASSHSKTRNVITWASADTYKELSYFDEDEEREMLIGKDSNGSNSITTYLYTLGDSYDVLATYNDGNAAVVRHAEGKGRVYAFSFTWRDLIQRSQLGKDFGANRTYNNGFEATADCAPLLVRQAYTLNHETSVWKHTIPDGMESVFIPTHDVDSRTAYDSLFYMSRYETEVGVEGHYNLTTKYFRDSRGQNFYNDATIAQAREELLSKHTIGNHSVGHFPDMADASRFPMGDFDITKENYNPYHENDTTHDAYTYAEVAVANSLLESDFGVDVNSFRSGHLCMNKYLDEAMQRAGISYASCWTAADLLSEFPFMERTGHDWSGEEAVLEMPMHVSDVTFPDKVAISESNFEERAAIWVDVAKKLQGNYAPCIILIHPNREWKMKAERYVVEHLDRDKVGLYNFIDYGDFWTNRRQLSFSTAVSSTDGGVLITIPKEEIASAHGQGLVLTTSKQLEEKDIHVVDEDGTAYSFTLKALGGSLCIVL